MKPQSLQSLAIQYLARREYSRAELSRKLAQPSAAVLRHAKQTPDAEPFLKPSAQEVNAVLDDLERQGFLNDARFALSLLHRKAGKLGAARLMQELSQHKLAPTVASELSRQLKDTELARCHAAWQQRFGHKHLTSLDVTLAQSVRDKHMRFLLARGFASDAVRKVLAGWQPEDEA
jgi:regulatory protein